MTLREKIEADGDFPVGWSLHRRTLLAGTAAGLAAPAGPAVRQTVDAAALRSNETLQASSSVQVPLVKELTPFLDRLRIPPIARLKRFDGVSHLTVEMRTALVHLHSQLPPTRVWAYDGHFPGPTIEVRRGEKLRVTWQNKLTGNLPLTVVEVPNVSLTPAIWDQPGLSGYSPREDVAKLAPWPVVHLHGALTGSGNDGWPENVIRSGTAQLSEYPNDQPATVLFYHDHAMGVTRWNVMAGLSGMYVIRDQEEKALGLPSGAYEVPLLLADRNLETDTDGHLTGGLLHKTVIIHTKPLLQMRAFTGPFTTVNGVIWPYHDVEPRWYRFRVVNASNTRQYRLTLVGEDGKPVPVGTAYQIGTDSGLLPQPLPIGDGITLASAERADLLVDFSAFRAQRLRLVNTNPNPDPGPWPQVMEFRVGSQRVHDPFVLPRRLSRDFVRLVESRMPDAVERLIVLTPMGPGQALCWEMEKTDKPSGMLPIDGIVQIQEKDGTVTTYRRTSADFYDPVRFFARTNSWERWRFLHVAPRGWAHPMHIHATSFQILGRETYDVSGFTTFTASDGSIGCGTRTPVKWTGTGSVSPEEEGWKDTVRANAGELVTITGYFGNTSGKFVYHCHMLEHEDMGMMRQFVILPGQIQDLGSMTAPSGASGGPGM
ncbi:MAG: multicopper oxidase domain-containing protein [Streptomycetaceae bacterium]|nr:multicopper oxidase domain-containing protein [Streptomycetaceae bacterium]